MKVSVPPKLVWSCNKGDNSGDEEVDTSYSTYVSTAVVKHGKFSVLLPAKNNLATATIHSAIVDPFHNISVFWRASIQEQYLQTSRVHNLF